MGFAACAADFPGHGPTIPADDLEIYLGVLKSRGLEPFMLHLVDSRYRDLNNDGDPDSGGDQWSADAFHTRDMVRQAAVDWMWLAYAQAEVRDAYPAMLGDWMIIPRPEPPQWPEETLRDACSPGDETYGGREQMLTVVSYNVCTLNDPNRSREECEGLVAPRKAAAL